MSETTAVAPATTADLRRIADWFESGDCGHAEDATIAPLRALADLMDERALPSTIEPPVGDVLTLAAVRQLVGRRLYAPMSGRWRAVEYEHVSVREIERPFGLFRVEERWADTVDPDARTPEPLVRLVGRDVTRVV